MNRPDLPTGLSALAMAIGFNVPYGILAGAFGYPDILRRPPGEILEAFAVGGDALVATWYAFGLAAALFVPLAVAIALDAGRLARTPVAALTAAAAGALAGAMQAIGLFRWVFVVPGLAAAHADPATRAAAEGAFALIHAFAGVAVGEHLGQLLTALFAGTVAWMQAREGRAVLAGLGAATAVCIAVGTGEGLAIATGRDGDLFSLFTIAGFSLLSLWLAGIGMAALRAALGRSPVTA